MVRCKHTDRSRSMSAASKPATTAFALLTGASSGIGAIYADRLAKRRRSVAPLFRPFVLSKLSLANRVVMAPMTRQKSPGGIPGPEVAAYYRRRAENGAGLIITEGTVVDDPVSTMSADIPSFYGPALDGWLRVVDAVHEVGGKIMPQLWHAGMARNPAKAPHPELPSAGPSGLTMRGFPGLTQPGLQHSEPMTREHIRRAVEAFGQAAADAQRLGFDGVEIHGAHGYLIDQFFWAGANQRTDEYGGDLVSRTRFAVEITRGGAPRDRAGFPDHPALLAMEAAGLRSPAREDVGRARPFSGAAIDRRRRYLPLFPASLLGAGIRGLRPEPRRLDQEAHRQAHRHRRQRGVVRRCNRLVTRRIFLGHRDRRPARAAGARRVRSGRGRPRAAGRSGLDAQGAGGPLRRAAALRARGARDPVLTPRVPGGAAKAWCTDRANRTNKPLPRLGSADPD